MALLTKLARMSGVDARDDPILVLNNVMLLLKKALMDRDPASPAAEYVITFVKN